MLCYLVSPKIELSFLFLFFKEISRLKKKKNKSAYLMGDTSTEYIVNKKRFQIPLAHATCTMPFHTPQTLPPLITFPPLPSSSARHM